MSSDPYISWHEHRSPHHHPDHRPHPIQHVGFALGPGPDIAAKVLTTLFAGLILGGLWLWMRRLMPLVLAHWGLDLLFLGLPTLATALL